MQHRSGFSPPVLRWLLVAAVLLVELLAMTIAFETPEGRGGGGFADLLVGNLALIAKTLVAFSACVFILAFRMNSEVRAAFLVPGDRLWSGWLALHLVLMSVFWFLTGNVLGPTREASVSLVGLWFLSGGLAVAPLLLIAAPLESWRSIARAWSRPILLCGCVAILIVACSTMAQLLWPLLAEITLQSVKWILSAFYPLADHGSKHIVGTLSFAVDVAPQCSGIEGIGMILVFLGLYVWMFRAQLRFPAVFWLFPIGVIAIWTANVLRIVTLIAIGSSFSSEIALGGFHSQAGWIGFCSVSLALILVADRVSRPLGHAVATTTRDTSAASVRALLVPLMVSLGASMLVDAASSGTFRHGYPLIAVATLAAIWFYRDHYRRHLGLPDAATVGIALAVFVAWLLLVPPAPERGALLAADLRELPPGLQILWLAFRVAGSVIAVPIVEELAFRGYLLPRLAGHPAGNLGFERTPWLAVVVSSGLFGLMHANWLAGFVAGAGFAFALIRRNRMSDAIWAHAICNGMVAIAAIAFGRWDLWG
ncbi:MAG TPA: exosortase E/protease, VPEID-CTERM system [Rhodocyclaceae bacterium]|nr:exosortase E/protease, VPEID-CTERM system [Rhodocyclaceae bacterium]HMZ83719.1 exosortase E/protease, VPEID-CTERM system [Rhodocyclaceae bacterium]HNA03805.1 exosortase E/protease, VPEID-CTERM system [Rhodocyclaceae bacterium]HNB77903.1 exosortase E/protease, VPEID-CTERM system [Rhodocyclaceae bacterium]HNC60148.1 exosortase E/protease, VPEID-CTERM system [Rhodocyclaceae bacterium]